MAGGLWGVLSVFSVFSCVVLKVDLEHFGEGCVYYILNSSTGCFF